MKKPLLFFALLLLVSALWAQNRYALVIGNADYPRADDKLPNAINDTNDISNELKDLGFSVTLRQNLRYLDMIREINTFIALLGRNGNSEGFFWYGGHAVELGGKNYLMPLDVNTEDEDITIATSYSVTTLLEKLAGARNKVNVVVLDSCRVPPRIGGGSRGDTARVIKTVPQVPPDVLVVYSTASGAVAYDGDGKRNSPFTEAFKKYIKSTEPLIQMVSHVTTETMSLTSQRQRPYTSGSMGSENAYYSLNPSGSRPVQPVAPPVNPAVPVNPSPGPSPSPAPTSAPEFRGGFEQTGLVTHDMQANGFAMAHPSLPLNTKMIVVNTSNGKWVEVTVISRLPASANRIADISMSAWIVLDLTPNTKVHIYPLL